MDSKLKVMLFPVIFLGTICAMPFGIVHASTLAPTSSLPGVLPGDNATYVPVNVSWQTNNATAFPNQLSDIGQTRQIALRVTTVSGTNVTFAETFYFRNGTTVTTDVVNVDVRTQSFCDTQLIPNQTLCSFETASDLQAIIATGLQAPNATGANPSITLNQTVIHTILGAQRTINILNATVTSPAPPPGTVCSPEACSTVTFSTDIAWDQASGIVVDATFSEVLDSATAGNAIGSFTFTMTGTNIWARSFSDFSIASNPSNVTVQGGSTGSSAITLTSINGFTGIVTLQASTSSALLSCSLNETSLTLGVSASSTIACSGSAGTYAVTVTGTAGSLSHSTVLTYTILHGHRHHPKAA